MKGCFWIFFFSSFLAVALPTNEVVLHQGARVAIMTGTYSPPHNRHHEIFEQLLASGLVDFVLVVPNDVTPHKPFALHAEARLKMLEIAYKDHPKILYPHDIKELGFPLASQARKYLDSKGSSLSWIGVMGEDSLNNKWARLGTHFQNVQSWIALSLTPVPSNSPPLRLGNKPLLRLYAPTTNDVHSKEIRQAAAKQDLVALKSLVPSKVAEFILQEGLYAFAEPKPTGLDYIKSCLKILSQAF